MKLMIEGVLVKDITDEQMQRVLRIVQGNGESTPAPEWLHTLVLAGRSVLNDPTLSYDNVRRVITAINSAQTVLDSIEDVRQAVQQQGRSPLYHSMLMARHRREWPTLWKALDKLMGVR